MTKEKSCLVTQSLIGAVDWYLTAPDTIIKPDKGGDGKQTWKEKAYNDLLNSDNTKQVKIDGKIDGKIHVLYK